MIIEDCFPSRLCVVVSDRRVCGWIEEGGGVGEPDFEVVTEFSDRADGRARGLDRVRLVDCDRGSDVFDAVDFGTVE